MTTVADIILLMKEADIARNKVDSLSPDQPLDEQGLDSYDRMTLLTELEERFNVELPNQIANQLKTLDDIVAYLNRSEMN
ncbi:MAG: acyl carrier protein [Planctomycetaceae bacterium]|nr:acyl carrier protein [Planctomycetales bacterium]MCB9925223.1 acyl carrier protein [Planctomycetaceae bacterium]